MRIALFSDTYIPEVNGVATSVFTLFQALTNRGHEVFVVTTNPFGSKTQIEGKIIRVPGIELKRIYGYRMASFYYPYVFNYMKNLKLDLIHVHTEYGIGIFGKILAIRLHLPVVYTYHTMLEDYTHYLNKGHFEYLSKYVINSISRFFGDTCTELISPSNKTKEALRRYGVETHINIVPTGIDLAKFKEENVNPEAVNKLKEQYRLEGVPLILYLGRIAPEKGIDVLLRGFAQIPPTSGIKMMIAGGGPGLVKLEQMAEELHLMDRVIFTGKVPQSETQVYYQLATLFASASLTETQGLTFLEAMAAGKPILWRYDKNLDEMLQDGETGFIFNDEKDFGVKVLQYLQLTTANKSKMKQQLLSRSNEFSSEVFYDNIMEVYHRAIRKKW